MNQIMTKESGPVEVDQNSNINLSQNLTGGGGHFNDYPKQYLHRTRNNKNNLPQNILLEHFIDSNMIRPKFCNDLE